MSKNEYPMWEGGPTPELPLGYHFDAKAFEIVKTDLTWRGDPGSFYQHQQEQLATEKEAK